MLRFLLALIAVHFGHNLELEFFVHDIIQDFLRFLFILSFHQCSDFFCRATEKFLTLLVVDTQPDGPRGVYNTNRCYVFCFRIGYLVAGWAVIHARLPFDFFYLFLAVGIRAGYIVNLPR